MGCVAKELGFNSQKGEEVFLFSTVSRLVAHPAFYLMGTRVFLPRCEADHLHQVLKLRIYGAVLPLYCLSSWHGA
jgi:hypothetical protein